MKKKNVRTEHSSVLIACLFVFAVLFMCLPPRAKGQYRPPDSCLKMIWPNDYDPFNNTGSYNPDSVRIDTCIDSPTFGKQFAKQFYYIQLPENFYPFDTILTDSMIKRVDDMNNNHLTFKLRFEQLDSVFGPIYFTGHHDNPNDSIFLIITFLIFSRYLLHYIISPFS